HDRRHLCSINSKTDTPSQPSHTDGEKTSPEPPWYKKYTENVTTAHFWHTSRRPGYTKPIAPGYTLQVPCRVKTYPLGGWHRNRRNVTADGNTGKIPSQQHCPSPATGWKYIWIDGTD